MLVLNLKLFKCVCGVAFQQVSGRICSQCHFNRQARKKNDVTNVGEGQRETKTKGGASLETKKQNNNNKKRKNKSNLGQK